MVAALLRTAADAARRAVARPVAGTILTVADAAADAAEDALGPIIRTTRWPSPRRPSAARTRRLARTPDQLAVLAAAGVVDAGGQAYVLLLDVLVEVLGGAPAAAAGRRRRPPAGRTGGAAGRPPLEYEVMYALRGAGADDLDALRERAVGARS